MKKFFYGAALALLLLISGEHVGAANFSANDSFKSDVNYYGVYNDGDDGVVYAMYQDFDNDGFKDIYYVKLVNGSYGSSTYVESIYINNQLVLRDEYFGPASGWLQTNQLNIAYHNGQLYRGFPYYAGAWEAGGMKVQSWANGKFNTLAELYFIDDDPEGLVGFKYYSHDKKITENQYNKLYAPYKTIPWTQVIVGGAGDNKGYYNSAKNVEAVLQRIEAEENLFNDGRTFKDVAKSSEIYAAVENLVDYGAVSDSAYLFYPNNPVTRGQASKMIVRGLQINLVNEDVKLTDVKPTNNFYDFIATLKANGIMNGINSNTFGVNQTLTRGQMARILTKALKLPTSSNSYKFTDVTDASLQASINSLADAKIINTNTNKYNPSKPVTRGQMALFLNRAMQYKNQ